MKSLRFYDIHDLRLENSPIPHPIPGEVRLKTASVGICGSDIHYYNEGSTTSMKVDHPLILGHEFSAWIDEGDHKGQLVAVDPALPCGHCEFCQEGNPNFCSELRFAGAESSRPIHSIIDWILLWNAARPMFCMQMARKLTELWLKPATEAWRSFLKRPVMTVKPLIPAYIQPGAALRLSLLESQIMTEPPFPLLLQGAAA